MILSNNYNPDVLTCLANLSNDEVFTPPQVVNRMLDMLPAELFRSKETKFLDPVSKSGVFLREIAKRLMIGLESQIPDIHDRADHILTHQLYGIAITELTALTSRRSVYCSKYANGQYSICRKFHDEEGNLRYRAIEHTFVDGKCKYCGASESVFGKEVRKELESHAYEFIHTDKPEKIFGNMKFDVIIGNPPYQLDDGGNGASAIAIYPRFIQQAKKLNPRYLSMIIPARWYMTGRSLDSFRNEMLTDERIRELHDFIDSTECFSGVEIKGGICYFLWERDSKGLCRVVNHMKGEIKENIRPLLEPGLDTFIRSSEEVSILHKVRNKKEQTISDWLNAGRFYGFHTKFIKNNDTKGKIQTADGKDYIDVSLIEDAKKVHLYLHGPDCWIDKAKVPRNTSRIDEYKVLTPEAGNPGSTIVGKPLISEPGSCSTNTYIVLLKPKGKLSREEAENIISYIRTNFFRFLVGMRTSTQHMPPIAYSFVPIQDFSHSWTDEMLYKKYGLDDEEIAFIESMIRPME